MFTRNAAASDVLVGRLLRVLESFGATPAEARRLVGKNANAAWVSNFGNLTGLGARPTGLLRHCLR